MRKSITILAATLTAVLFSGAAIANDDKPAKKPAAEAASAQPVDDTWITTKVKSSLLADTAVAGTKIDVDTGYRQRRGLPDRHRQHPGPGRPGQEGRRRHPGRDQGRHVQAEGHAVRRLIRTGRLAGAPG